MQPKPQSTKMPFSQFVIAAAGSLKSYTHEDLEALVNTHGGEFSEVVEAGVTHLICSTAAYHAKTLKVKSGIENSVIIIDVHWIEDCLKQKEALSETKYLLENSKKDDSKVEASTTGGGASEQPLDGESAGKRLKTSDGTQVMSKPESKYIHTSVGDGGISEALEAKQIIMINVSGPQWTKKWTPKHIYKNPEKIPSQKWLARCRIGEQKTSNKIMLLEILETNIHSGVPRFVLRVVKLVRDIWHEVYVYSEPDSGPSIAKTPGVLTKVYESELQKRISQGYISVDLDTSTDYMNIGETPVKDTLKARDVLYDLINLVFPDHKISPIKLKARPTGYDKLVFRNISQKAVDKGAKILATLEIMAGSTRKQKTTMGSKFAELTSSYYSYIPHSFEPDELVMLLDSRKIIRKELNMLLSLDEIMLSACLASEFNLRDNGHDKILGRHFKELGLKNIKIVNKDSPEFMSLDHTFTNTGGRGDIPASWTLQIFRIERSGDSEEDYNPVELDKTAKLQDDRRHMLWHGTPLGNMGATLKKGLKNVSRERRIFFSETAGTSLEYSQEFNGFRGKIGSMLVCEVQPGHMSRLSYDHYKPRSGFVGKIDCELGQKWSDAGEINQNLKGVQMLNVGQPNNCIYEYVADSSTSVIKVRYLVLCRPGLEKKDK